MTHKGPLQPLPFCDSVILWKTSANKKNGSVFIGSELLQVQQSKRCATETDRAPHRNLSKPAFRKQAEKRAMYMQTKNWSLNSPCLGTLLSSFLSAEVLPPAIVSEACTQNTLGEEGNGWYRVLQRSGEQRVRKQLTRATGRGEQGGRTPRLKNSGGTRRRRSMYVLGRGEAVKYTLSQPTKHWKHEGFVESYSSAVNT